MKIVITGGPHTGKTTLMKELSRYGIIVPESATILIDQERMREKVDPGHAPIYPMESPIDFQHSVARITEGMESAVRESQDILVFHDRGLIDNLVFARHRDSIDENEDARMVRAIRRAKYDKAFICEPVGSYQKTEVRSEDEQESLEIHALLRKTYKEFMHLISIPAISVLERVNLVMRRVSPLYRKYLEAENM